MIRLVINKTITNNHFLLKNSYNIQLLNLYHKNYPILLSYYKKNNNLDDELDYNDKKQINTKDVYESDLKSKLNSNPDDYIPQKWSNKNEEDDEYSNDLLVSTSLENMDYDPVDPKYILKYNHNDHFDYSTVKNIHDIPEGGFTSISTEDEEAFLFEGYAGEMFNEFLETNNNKIMVRQIDKVLTTLIDSHTIGFDKNSDDNTQAFTESIRLYDYTDRPEWMNTGLKINYYGSEIKVPSTKDVSRDGITIVKGPGSVNHKILQQLKEKSNNKLPNKIVITGDAGVGKSVALTKAVMHARANGWIVMYIHNAYEHVYGGSFIQPHIFDDNNESYTDISTLVSKRDEDIDYSLNEINEIRGANCTLFNNQDMTLNLLRNFFTSHNPELANFPIQFKNRLDKYKPYIDDVRTQYDRILNIRNKSKLSFLMIRREIFGEDLDSEDDQTDLVFLHDFNFETFEINNLNDLILLGIAFYDLCGAVFIDLMYELKHVKDKNICIAIDEYNYWNHNSVFKFSNKAIHSKQIIVPNQLNIITNKKSDNENDILTNGLYILSTSEKHKEIDKAKSMKEIRSSIPLLLTLGNYTQVEFLSKFLYYISLKNIENNNFLYELCSFRMYINSNPKKFRQTYFSYFITLNIHYKDNVDVILGSENDVSNDNDIKNIDNEENEENDSFNNLEDSYDDLINDSQNKNIESNKTVKHKNIIIDIPKVDEYLLNRNKSTDKTTTEDNDILTSNAINIKVFRKQIDKSKSLANEDIFTDLFNDDKNSIKKNYNDIFPDLFDSKSKSKSAYNAKKIDNEIDKDIDFFSSYSKEEIDKYNKKYGSHIDFDANSIDHVQPIDSIKTNNIYANNQLNDDKSVEYESLKNNFENDILINELNDFPDEESDDDLDPYIDHINSLNDIDRSEYLDHIYIETLENSDDIDLDKDLLYNKYNYMKKNNELMLKRKQRGKKANRSITS